MTVSTGSITVLYNAILRSIQQEQTRANTSPYTELHRVDPSKRLQDLTTPQLTAGTTQMTEDERVGRADSVFVPCNAADVCPPQCRNDKLYMSMQQKYSRCYTTTSGVQRTIELHSFLIGSEAQYSDEVFQRSTVTQYLARRTVKPMRRQ